MNEYRHNKQGSIELSSELIAKLKGEFGFVRGYDLEYKLTLITFTYDAVKKNYDYRMVINQKSLEAVVLAANNFVTAMRGLTSFGVTIVNPVLDPYTVTSFIELLTKLEREVLPLIKIYAAGQIRDGRTVALTYINQELRTLYEGGTGRSSINRNVLADNFQAFCRRYLEIIENT